MTFNPSNWIGPVRAVVGSGQRPHSSKLLHLLTSRKSLSAKKVKALSRILPAHGRLLAELDKVHDPRSQGEITAAVAALDVYATLLREADCDVFSPQGDFKSSVLSEFFLVLFEKLIALLGSSAKVSGQRDLLIEVTFDPRNLNTAACTTQRVDVAVFLPAKLELNDVAVPEFCVPIVAMEARTNLDKTMISGVEHSVSALKRTFPESLYYVVAEWADFDIGGQNYASTDIDEIYVLRPQKRSEYRKKKVSKPAKAVLVQHLISEVAARLEEVKTRKGDLQSRMRQGMLIRDA